MTLLANRKAIYRIIEDKLRLCFADRGAGIVAVARRLSHPFGTRLQYLNLLMLESRLSSGSRTTYLIAKRLPEIQGQLPHLVNHPTPDYSLDRDGFRAIVLRAPRWSHTGFQRGVMLIKFTETFRFFFHQIDIDRLLQYFRVVLEPSWSGYCLPEILMWTCYSDPIVIESSEARDRAFLTALNTNLKPIEIGASDWVDHRVFRPLGTPKLFDVIYVANLTPMKRVNVYLKALKTIRKSHPNFRAAIVLSTWGGNQVAFEQMVRLYKLEKNLTVLMNQTQSQLNELVNQSRVSVLLSRKEGSNKTLFESMFADTPVILISNNVGVNKDYINEHTGILATESELPGAILKVANDARFRPREWAMENISPERSTAKLEAKLVEIGDSPEGVQLHVKVNTPEATYMDPDVALTMPPITSVLRAFLLGSERSKTEERMRQLFDTSVTT